MIDYQKEAKRRIDAQRAAEVQGLADTIRAEDEAARNHVEAVAAAKVELEIATAEIAAADKHVADATATFTAAMVSAETALRTYWDRLRDLGPATHAARIRVNHARRVLGMQPIDGPPNAHNTLRSTFDLAGKATVAKHRQSFLGWLMALPSTFTQHGRMPS